MSRVADALRLAKLESTGADAFIPHSHPWGRTLTGADASLAETDEETAPSQSEIDENALKTTRLRTADAVREPQIIHAISPLTKLDTNIRSQIAGIVERVFLPPSGQGPRVVAFAGIDAEARSGWIAAAVADMLTQRTAARAAVVDLNFANPQVGDYFSIDPAAGDGAGLDPDASIAKPAHQVRTNLWAIPAEEQQAGPDLPAASRARISRLATVYDHVILSLEPLSSWCGGGVPALADGIVLVIAADTTRREAARQVSERLHTSGASILGAVLTNRRYAIPDAIYRRL